MQLTLNQQIALSLRRRPLVLPMLLATLCVDAVAIAYGASQPDATGFWYWGLLVPQLGLLSLWIVRGGRGWLTRVSLASAYLGLLVAVLGRMHHFHDIGGLTSLLLVYLVTIGCFAGAGWALRWMARLRDAHRVDGPPQFSMWQLMVTMTVVATAAAVSPHLSWGLDWREVPIFIGLIAMVLLAYYGSFLRPAPWAGLGMCLLPALSFEAAYVDGPRIHGIFLGSALTCWTWLTALSFNPDARRRLIARRQRRRQPMPRLKVVLPGSESREFPVGGTADMGFDAKG